MGADFCVVRSERLRLRGYVLLGAVFVLYVSSYVASVDGIALEVSVPGRGIVTFESYKWGGKTSELLFWPMNVIDRFAIRASMWQTWSEEE
jgi:hypothetical protein